MRWSTSASCVPQTPGCAARAAEVLLGFRGTKEGFENDPRKNKARRLVTHGIKMIRGGYRLLLRYPIKTQPE
ncbi:DNA -binding domain-containing protein [Pseudogemmobacter hezensis]|uniref:DNA -binding domain-containing protein n=1 Tax=Pseudogemmobacter hezensis TaxID=2737662 RepID=UPI0034599554